MGVANVTVSQQSYYQQNIGVVAETNEFYNEIMGYDTSV